MITETENQYFYIISYFLNGHFVKWEEVVQRDQFNIDIADELTLFLPSQDNYVSAKVVSTEVVSEDEYKVFLVS